MNVLVAVTAAKRTVFLIHHVKDCLHGLVVCNALGVAAFYNAAYLIGHGNHLFFYHLIVTDNIQYYVGCYDRQLSAFLLGEIAVSYLDDAFALHLPAAQVGADGDGGVNVCKSQQVDYVKNLVRRNVVNYRSVLKRRNQQL